MPSPPHLKLLSSTKNPTAPPRHLGKPGADLWSSVVAELDVSKPAVREELTQIAEAKDRLAELKQRIDAKGLMIPGKNGELRENLLVKLELQHPRLRGDIKHSRLQRHLGSDWRSESYPGSARGVKVLQLLI